MQHKARNWLNPKRYADLVYGLKHLALKTDWAAVKDHCKEIAVTPFRGVMKRRMLAKNITQAKGSTFDCPSKFWFQESSVGSSTTSLAQFPASRVLRTACHDNLEMVILTTHLCLPAQRYTDQNGGALQTLRCINKCMV